MDGGGERGRRYFCCIFGSSLYNSVMIKFDPNNTMKCVLIHKADCIPGSSSKHRLGEVTPAGLQHSSDVIFCKP